MSSVCNKRKPDRVEKVLCGKLEVEYVPTQKWWLGREPMCLGGFEVSTVTSHRGRYEARNGISITGIT